MGRTNSNNNKRCQLITHCMFAIRAIYTRITVTWGIRYIDEDFFVWIIPSTYLSHEVINWACTAGFACIQNFWFYRFLCCFLSLGDNSGYMNSRYSDVRYIWYIYEGFFIWIIPSTYQPYGSIIWAYITGFIIFTLLVTFLPAPVYMCLPYDF